ncbi:MAG: magnesium transporter CorA [Chitinophagaceae bacterium]|nr:MAG: magnesium transporter CorA [Chitinophagaceae bacterium]
MEKLITSEKQSGYDWIDVIDPSQQEMDALAKKYSLHPASVKDAMETDHLPKFEHLRGHTFAILRVYSRPKDAQADSLQELTDKISVFIADKLIITVHRHEWPELERIHVEHVQEGECTAGVHVFNEIAKAALRSFDDPAKELTRTIEYYENQIFLKDRKAPIIKGLYFLKRKVDVILRVLLLSYDIVDNIDPQGKGDENTRDIRDLYVKQQTIYDSMASNTHHLLSIYFNVSAQKTNDTIRVLTIFSVFFLPLTFIVGVYGMNFHFMPELKWKYGYPLALLFMGMVVAAIWIWFKKKKWL